MFLTFENTDPRQSVSLLNSAVLALPLLTLHITINVFYKRLSAAMIYKNKEQ